MWAYPTTDMQCEWLGERVATVDINRAINNVILDREDAGWGPNAVFRFPLEGGTGAIWKKVAKLIPDKNQVSLCQHKCTQIISEGSSFTTMKAANASTLACRLGLSVWESRLLIELLLQILCNQNLHMDHAVVCVEHQAQSFPSAFI